MNNTAVLEGIRCILRLYEELCAPLRERYGLSQSKIDVIAFLANNPGRDTQSDIAELRNIPKANVSLCVSDLMERGMIKRTVDPSDRRISHLSLCGAAEEIAEELKKMQRTFKDILFTGFNEKEKELYSGMNARISANASGERKDAAK